jgi:hypothetical protein
VPNIPFSCQKHVFVSEKSVPAMYDFKAVPQTKFGRRTLAKQF